MNKVVTYSPAYTLVPTYECFNRCSYCNFRVDIGKDIWLTISAAKNKLKNLPSTQIAEILVLSGEVHPASSRRASWFERIYQLCELALSMDFLPHTNVGPLSWQEMKQLKQVNVSLGLMLEQLNPKFLTTVHRQAPSKKPELRLQQLEWAGKLKIPFTTGLLLGIGETKADRQETLEAIANIHRKWGNIQEVILQPHSVGSRQQLNAPSFTPHLLVETIAQARAILPDSIAIQIPPNLVTPQFFWDCLAAGATDLGGISPKDEVNPDYPHPTKDYLEKILEPAGWQLKPRLPVYQQYYSWLSPALQSAVKAKAKALKCF
ncbi:7,8-didemethyl-8-hydroxy-5-deazariboflavin synthase subunit CofG [Myxosarcina sp. GI1]|uniref:7,8-didemethyl-8-hydroxy-5-deazariboflavin synthase subunit CofG n=1 Tax=Myxosarcina sp. GI1 TaxID=1541065 RepID=UPI00055EF028|nr:7,8-didemethyl-8-hydroxy-5-deazariboflavin synthase subunit CofG [Myxosarcina sp. GI1]